MGGTFIIGTAPQSDVLACLKTCQDKGYDPTILCKERDRALLEEQGIECHVFSGYIDIKNTEFFTAVLHLRPNRFIVACGAAFCHQNIVEAVREISAFFKLDAEVLYHAKGELQASHCIQSNRGHVYFPFDINYQFQPDLLGGKPGEPSYLMQYYSEQTAPSPTHPRVGLDKRVEILLGSTIESPEKYILDLEPNSVLPVSIPVPGINTAVDNDWAINVKANDETHKLRNLAQNRYHYLPFPEGGEVAVSSKHPLIVGKPLSLKQAKPTRCRLAMMLFVDGLSSKIFEYESFEKLMPNTHAFFSKGLHFTECYANGHWTLDSVPAIFTGKTPVRHGIYHPGGQYDVSLSGRLISECMQNAGYLTFQASTVGRMSPYYGYAKGFDRTIYKQSQDTRETLSFLFEQLRAFDGRNQFIFSTVFELHHMLNHIPDLSCQFEQSLFAHDHRVRVAKSVRQHPDKRKAERYLSEIRRLDFYLGQLYRFIEDNYDPEECCVALISDHGQAFLEGEHHVLSAKRVHVPFMLRGPGVPQGVSDELIENVDMFPSMLHVAGADFDGEDIDGQLPVALGGKTPREYVVSECIYPEQPYKVLLRDRDYAFYLETEDNVDEDGRVSLSEYSTRMRLRNGGGEGHDPDKAEQWTRMLLERAQGLSRN